MDLLTPTDYSPVLRLFAIHIWFFSFIHAHVAEKGEETILVNACLQLECLIAFQT